MELKDFVRNTLLDIAEGVREANGDPKRILQPNGQYKSRFIMHSYISKPGSDNSDKDISFDVAVTVSQDSEAKGSGGLKIFVAGLDGELMSKNGHEYVTRIKFNVSLDGALF